MAWSLLGENYSVKVYVADSDADLATIPEKVNKNYVVGTTCKCISDGKTYMLKSDGTWTALS